MKTLIYCTFLTQLSFMNLPLNVMSLRLARIVSQVVRSSHSSSLSHRGSTKIRASAASLPYSIRIAYQGEPGAYSEKASRELLGPRVTTVNYESFEDAFKAVALKEADYAVVPIENSLGGSIHTNFDLLLRYDLHVIGEHEFRVEHSLLALPGVKKSDIKRIMSHPQALAQCDNYIRQFGAQREATYDTAGSAKMIRDNDMRDCAAIASDLAGITYGLDVLESNIEDHDNNFTRFLLLSRSPVSALLPPASPAKTSIVFLLPNNPGALYKALACFSLRDIDFCKIESRPTSVQLLQSLQLKQRSSSHSPPASAAHIATGTESSVNSLPAIAPANSYTGHDDLPRFQYTFYLDFLAAELDDRAQNALAHLREQSQFVRVLGSYPRGGSGARASDNLIGPIRSALGILNKIPVTTEYPSSPLSVAVGRPAQRRLKIGIIGFGKFGQFLAKTFVKSHEVICTSKEDYSGVAKELGCQFIPLFDLNSLCRAGCDVLLLSVSIISFESVLKQLPPELFENTLVVDVLSVKTHAKEVMLRYLPENCDVLCTHPMFGPESGKLSWQGLPFLFDKVRVTRDQSRADAFLAIWEKERCKMIEMSCEQHDQYAANSQFITHLTGRILWQQNLTPTPIDTKGFQTVLNLVENTCKDSFDLFFGLYYYNTYAASQLQNIREALAQVERQLAAKEAYLAAKAEASSDGRSRLLEECKQLMKDVLAENKAEMVRILKGQGQENGTESSS